MPYDALNDFTPVTNMAMVPLVALVNPRLPVRSLRELADHAKANPGRVSYASSSIGGAQHLAGEMFKQIAGVDMVHVPYRGAGPAIQDLIAGNVQVMFDSVPAGAGAVREGLLRPLAALNARRVAGLSRTCRRAAEAGLPGPGDLHLVRHLGAAAHAGRDHANACSARWRWRCRTRRCARGSRRSAPTRSPTRRRPSTPSAAASREKFGAIVRAANITDGMMRAIVCESWRDFDALELKDIPPPPMRPRGVRIRVAAAGVSFATQLVVAGKYQRKPPLPFVPGTEVVGTVIESRARCRRAAAGHARLRRARLGRLCRGGGGGRHPCRADPGRAADGTGGRLADLLPDRGGRRCCGARGSQPGDWVLVQGAAGGVGLAGVEIAKAMGARVIARGGRGQARHAARARRGCGAGQRAAVPRRGAGRHRRRGLRARHDRRRRPSTNGCAASAMAGCWW